MPRNTNLMASFHSNFFFFHSNFFKVCFGVCKMKTSDVHLRQKMFLPYPGFIGTIGASNYYQDTEMVALINKCGIHKINSNVRLISQ